MIRSAALSLVVLAGLVLTVVSPARAGIPSPTSSTSPAFIRLVGSAAGAPDSVTGKVMVTVNDIAHNPRAGSFVTVDFSACSADIRIASNQLNPNYTTSCATHSVSAYTNAAGQAAFTILGSSFVTGTHTVAGCARIYADGVLLSTPTIATCDMDGANGLSSADLSAILGDIIPHVYCARSDIDGSGTLSSADLSVELGAINRHKSTSSGAVCP